MNSRVKENVKKLFEYWCEVTKSADCVNNQSGVIIESFPESFRDEQIIAKIPDFAYPCEFECDSVQSYSFVLTSDDSKWRFGFCRHDSKTNSAMIVITYLPWHDTFLKLLTVLAELRRAGNGDFATFLSEAYNKGVPDPGGSLKLFYNNGQSYFVFERPLQFQLPSIPENHNLNLYYNFVDPKNMISVFAAMLAERRIIFTSRRLDRLSSCVQAANAFLYPMVWQHIFIPVLPMKLKDILSAPMPYLIGVPEPVLETMTPEELGEVVILNCDTKIFESPFDDMREMPPEIVSQLKKHLSHSNEHIGDRVSKIFLCVLVQLIGGYRDAIEFGAERRFNRQKFIDSRPNHLRPFLTKMMDLQIFQQFIDERLEMLNTGLGFSDEFELETVRYAEKLKKRGRNYAFLKNVKDKVKEGSKGVKTAYKDLKSRFRDITPPKTNFHSHVSNSHHDSIGGGFSGKHPGPHSAPSSPIFNKRSGFAYATPVAINQNGYSNITSSSTVATHQVNLGISPTVSPTGSYCSSEMNLSQELQNHPLFKSPTVDRTRSLQQQYQLQAPSVPPPAPPSSASSRTEASDLISLDDSSNVSFDLEDFDPLNQNAKPMPSTIATSGCGSKSTTLPTAYPPNIISSSVSNPLYPYFTPQHRNTLPPSKGSLPVVGNNECSTTIIQDDDIELLRKYGLDQFTLTVAPTGSTSSLASTRQQAMRTAASVQGKSFNSKNNPTIQANVNNWTTFD